MKLLTNYEDLPESLLLALQNAGIPASCDDTPSCRTDESDCSSDSYCRTDESDCSLDHSTCTSECTDKCTDCTDHPCTDCTDCTDHPPSQVELSFTAGGGGFQWHITGLSAAFTTGNGYVRAGITKDQFTVGGVGQISGIIDYKTAASTGSTTVTKWSDYAPGTYVFWGFVETRQGGYWPAGSAAVEVPRSFTPFDWTYAGLDLSRTPPSTVYGSAKRQGLGVYVTADEWNELADLVETVTGSSVSRVDPGDPISRTVVNEMARALGVPTVGISAPISAAFFNDLRAAYNALG